MPWCLSFLMLKFMKIQQSLNRINHFPMQADQVNFNPFPHRRSDATLKFVHYPNYNFQLLICAMYNDIWRKISQVSTCQTGI